MIKIVYLETQNHANSYVHVNMRKNTQSRLSELGGIE